MRLTTSAQRFAERRRPAPEPNDTKCRGFGDSGTAQVTLGDARAPSQSCGAASFYLDAEPVRFRSAVLLGPKPIFTGAKSSENPCFLGRNHSSVSPCCFFLASTRAFTINKGYASVCSSSP